MAKAYSYMRFSTPEQAKGDSKRRQTQQAEEYAAENGLELDDKLTYRDYGVSAFRGANVEIGKLGQFMEAIRRKEVESGSFLLVESLDRISRDVILPAQNLFTQIILEGVTIVTLADKRVYSAELVNRAPFLLIEAIVILIRANEESETKSKRLKAVWENKRNSIAAKPMTSQGPAWLKFNVESQKFEVIPERGAIVERIYREHLAGKGCSSIARRLRQEKIPTWTREKGAASIWREYYIWKILNSPAVIGTLTPHKMDHSEGKKRRVPLAVVKDYYPPAISEELYTRVHDIRLNFKRLHKASLALKNIFSMLGRCPQCGARLMYVNKGQPLGYLICTESRYGQGCELRSIRYPRLEAVFLTEFVAALSALPPDNPVMSKVHLELAEIRNRFKDVQDEQIRLFEFLELGTELDKFKATRSTSDEFERLDRTIGECQKELKRLMALHEGLEFRQMDNLTKEFIAAVSSEPLNRERANSILRSMCDNILVSSGRIEVRFKLGPTLCIEYDKKWSKFAYVKVDDPDGENAAGVRIDTDLSSPNQDT